MSDNGTIQGSVTAPVGATGVQGDGPPALNFRDAYERTLQAALALELDARPDGAGAPLAQAVGLAKYARPPTPEPEKPRDTRERKYVYVLEGVLRGMAALEKRVGAVGAISTLQTTLTVALMTPMP